MAKIDEKVVEMRFDNRHFEKHAKESMSTLEKLKSKLDFKKSQKSMDNLSKSAKNFKMDGMIHGIETVQAKFSTMQIAGVTAISRITNSVMQAGENMVRSLTIDPVKTGLSEYELKVNSVKTIMASTGKSVKEVTKYLDELNRYSDKTIYKFSDMTQNIGKFTNAGIELDDAVLAMKGISNEAAVSGASAEEAARAMYNISQAMSMGYVQLIDWKSIEYANMATKEFKTYLAETASEMGTLKKTADGYVTSSGDMYNLQQLFKDGLKDQWLTTDVLVSTLSDYADETTDIGRKAYMAAQDINTFTQMVGVLQETAQSGWARTWELIIGNIEEAKKTWTSVAEFFGKIVNGATDLRNAIVGGAMGFDQIDSIVDKMFNNKMIKGITSISKKIEDMGNITKKTTKTLDQYKEIVNRVWRGDFQNQPYRKGLLERAGWNYESVQSLVNLGYQHDITYEEMINAEKKAGLLTKEGLKLQNKENEAKQEYLEITEKISDEKLKELDLTDEEIILYRQLEKESKKAGKSMGEFLEEYKKKTPGQEVLKRGFANLGKSMTNSLAAVGKAWRLMFDEFTFFDLYKVIEKFEKLTQSVKDFTENKDNMQDITNIFGGLFAILKLVSLIIGGGFRIAWTLFTAVLKSCGMTVVDFMSKIGELIIKTEKWIENNNFIIDGIVQITSTLMAFGREVYRTLREYVDLSEIAKRIIASARDMAHAINAWFMGIRDADNIGKYIFDGLVDGLVYGSKKIFNFISKVANTMIKVFKDIFEIHSPSKVMFEEGKYILLGLYEGIRDTVIYVYELLKTIGYKIIDIIKDMDFGSVLVAVISGASLLAVFKLIKILEILADGIMSVNGVIAETERVLGSFRKLLNAAKIKIVASSIKDMAVAIAILVGSIVVLTNVEDTGKLWESVKVIVSLVAALAILATVAGYMGKGSELDFAKLSLSLLAIGISLSLMANAIKKITEIDNIGLGNIALIVSMIGGFIAALYALSKISITNKNNDNVKGLATLILSLGVTISLMASSVKKLGSLKSNQLKQGMKTIVGFSTIIGLLIILSQEVKSGKALTGLGKAMIGIGATLYIMTRVIKILGKMKTSQMIKGMTAIGVMLVMIKYLINSLSSLSGSKNVAIIGKSLIQIAGAISLLALSVKILGKMDVENLIKGGAAVTALTFLIVKMVDALKNMNGEHLGKIGKTVVSIAVAIGILAFAVGLLSIIKTEKLIKGVIAVGLITAMVTELIKATSKAKNLDRMMTKLALVIGVLFGSIVLLSLINPKRLIGPTLAMSMLMGMFALIVKSTKGLNVTSKTTLKSLGIMMLVIISLTGIVYALSKIDYEKAIGSSVGLSLLLLLLVASTKIMSTIGKTAGISLKGIAGLVAMLGIISILAGILYLMNDIKNIETNALALSMLLMVMVGVLSATALIGTAYAATGGLAATGLLGLVGILAAATMAIGVLYLMDNIKDADNKVSILTKLMESLTIMLVKVSIVGPLATMGIIAITGLIGAITIIGTLITGIGALFTAIPDLEKFINKGIPIMVKLADGIGQIIGKFIGSTISTISEALPKIGENLSDFMIELKPFIETSKTIDNKLLDGIKRLSASILLLSGANIIKGISSFLGLNKLSSMGSELSSFAKNSETFFTTMSNLKSSTLDGIKSLSEGILSLTKANLLNGISKFLSLGSNTFANFAKELPNLGTGLGEFVNNIGVFNDAQVKTVESAGKALESIAGASGSISKSSGVLQALFGTVDLVAFSEDMPKLGIGINGFVSKLTDVTGKEGAVDSACNVIKSVAEASKSVKNTGGYWQTLFGESGLSKFSNTMPTLGENINKFISSLKDVNGESGVVKVATNLINAFAKLANSNIKGFSGNSKAFGSAITSFASSLSKFIGSINTNETKAIDEAIGKTSKLVEAVASMVNKIGKIIDDKKGTVRIKFKNVVLEAVNAIDDKDVQKRLNDRGLDFVNGFANGIRNNKHVALDAARDMGTKALEALQKAEDAHSPSRETYKLGSYFGEGWLLALSDYSDKAYKSGENLGSNAKNGLNSAISRMASLIDSDMDMNPTIRPVLDLSDVNSGLSSMNSMFGSSSIGLMSNVNAINKDMNNRGQNGTNKDVVNAINKLKSSVDSNSGDVYNINGISYDASGEVEQAVQTLVRAALIERRV